MNFGFGNNFGFHAPQQNIDRITIIQKKDPHHQLIKSQNIIKTLNLLDKKMDFLPRNFTITTNNGSYKFNTGLLQNSCTAIAKALENKPDTTEFHIDIKDEDNIMQKFEDLYQGDTISINIGEVSTIHKIVSALGIQNCPDQMKPDILRNAYYSIQSKNEVLISKNSLAYFLQNLVPKTFIVRVNNKEYACNNYGINSSLVISEYRKQNPDSNEYVYNYENDPDDFQLICDFFDFKPVNINTNNMDSLKQIAEDLQINFILDIITIFINSYENAVQLIDDKKILIESIDNIFNLLYHIKDHTVETVKKSILQSFWSQTEENVQELVACILQVIRTRFSQHSYIIELIISLDKSANENNKLGILIPFLCNHLKTSFFKSSNYCGFVYRLSKHGLIQISEIIDQMYIEDGFLCYKSLKLHSSHVHDPDHFLHVYQANVISWFCLELAEIKNIPIDFLFNGLEESRDFLMNCFINGNFDEYKKIRDLGEPSDELIRAILYDDVDKLQSILSKGNININQNKIPPNLFETFKCNSGISYINYSAECGSLKCFKYLLLNHAEMNDFTFGYAVFGGNTEIIRIVDQNYSPDIKAKLKNKQNFGTFNTDVSQFITYNFDIAILANPIYPAIITHQNNLFDWILDQKFAANEIDNETLNQLAVISINHGNAHSIIELVDKGLDLFSFPSHVLDVFISSSAQQGFYRFMQLILSLIEKKFDTTNDKLNLNLNCSSFAMFGNLNIFKTYQKLKLKGNKNDILFLNEAVQNGYFNIIRYIVEDMKYTFQEKADFMSVFTNAISLKSPDIFKYLMGKYNIEQIMSNCGIFSKDFTNILCAGCTARNTEAVIILSEFILNKDSDFNFTQPFISACKSTNDDICQYFIEKNVSLNYFILAKNVESIGTMNEKLAFHLINNSNPEMKETFIQCFLNKAISCGNKVLVEFLLENSPPNNQSLFSAVNSNDIDIVNIVLKYNSKPSFINRISSQGTALNIAVKTNCFPIVQRLLSIPGIDPSLYERNNYTPLVSALTSFNLEMTNAILDFYGDEIQSQMWQINEALKEILKNLSTKLSNYSPGIEFFQVITRLLQIENIDFNCHVHKYTLLTYACEAGEVDLIKILLKSNKVNVNSYAPTNGNTPLMIAIENFNIEIAQLLIEYPRTNINLRNYIQKTALIFAVEKNLYSIVQLLINNERFDPEESFLNYAFYISSDQISSQLYQIKELDVNFIFDPDLFKNNDLTKNKIIKQRAIPLHNIPNDNWKSKDTLFLYETTLIHAINENKNEKINMIISHPSFDKIKSQVKSSVFVAVKKDQIEIFRNLLKLIDNDVNIRSQDETSLLVYSVKDKKRNFVQEILNHESFDPIKSDLFKAFMSAAFLSFNSAYTIQNFVNHNPIGNNIAASTDIMDDLYEYDENHSHILDFNKLLSSGKSFFTSIYVHIRNLNDVVDFFLDHNANPNVPDAHSIYPLEYALYNCSLGFFNKLIQSNQIDFSIRLSGNIKFKKENETFLHLAAQINDETFLIQLSNFIDINSVDSLGETPLMKAVRARKLKNIVSFFQNDDLDYKKCNNLGQDALAIARKVSSNILSRNRNVNIPNGITPAEKREYLENILNCL